MKRSNAQRTGRRGRGFTLVEVLVCSVLMVLGFLALVAAYGHDTDVAQRGADVTTATFLAEEVRDMALQMEFANVLALNGVTYPVAILSTGAAQDLANWSQRVTVTPVDAADLNDTVPAAGAKVARLSVEVRSNNVPVLTQTYYIFAMDGVPFTDGSG